MKRLACPACSSRVYFERVQCPVCTTELVFVPATSTMVWLDDPTVDACQNREVIQCNWATEADEPFCKACRLNRIVPNLSFEGNAERWQRIERAKRRLVVDLLRLGLPIVSRADEPETGLAFDLVSNLLTITPVRTGHESGLITLDIEEADDAVREARRAALREPYRTLLGHFRHEIAHYYFTLLVENDAAVLPAFRAIFGDEREDYQQALQRHYQDGAPPDWRERYITAYASSHPWEDWAETFAHFLHIVATLDTAIETSLVARDTIAEDAYRESDFDRIISAFRPLTEALNEINRSMGVADIYPFVLTPPVIGKLHFVHLVVQQAIATKMPVAPALAL